MQSTAYACVVTSFRAQIFHGQYVQVRPGYEITL